MITTLARWALALPTRALPPILARLDDVVTYHVIRGHDVVHNVVMGERDTPMRMWAHYCHTCEVAW